MGSGFRSRGFLEFATILDWMAYALCMTFFIANVLDQSTTTPDTMVIGFAIFAVGARIRILLRASRMDALRETPK